MEKKENFHKEFVKLMEQARKKAKSVGKELGILAKKSEKEIVKASKLGKIQLDMVGLNMQKEKLYYDIGKKVISLKAKKNLDIPGLENYWKKMRRLNAGTRKKKRELSTVRKSKN